MIGKKILISTIGVFVFTGCSVKSFDDLKSKIDEATTTYYSSGLYIDSRDRTTINRTSVAGDSHSTVNRGSIASGGSIVNRGSIVSGGSTVNRGSIASGGSSVGSAGSKVVIYNRKSYTPKKVTVRVLTQEELKRMEEENRRREAEFVERWRKRTEEARKNSSINWEW
jgi:hypothetical protein